jgi:hypothetical protein
MTITKISKYKIKQNHKDKMNQKLINYIKLSNRWKKRKNYH